MSAVVTFTHGRTYVARLHLEGMEAMLGNPGDVARKLAAAGFADPIVSLQPLPGAQAGDRFKSGETYWARGRFDGPTATVELPQQITDVWPVDANAKTLVAPPSKPPALVKLQSMAKQPKWIALGILGYLLYQSEKSPRRR